MPGNPAIPLPPGRTAGINNRLLLALPAAARERLLRLSEPVKLARGQRIDAAEQPIEHIYFINRGMVSIAKSMSDGRTVEIGAIGIEGVANLLPFVGQQRTILDIVVQIPGSALRLRSDAMKRETESDEAIRSVVQNHVRFGLSELARHVACGRLHHIEARCCRWLLVAHDNALGDEFPVTHEALAGMLGYQRAGVSLAMRSLVDSGLIRHRRGKVAVVDRAGLAAAACDCYREMQRELDQFLPVAPVGARILDFPKRGFTSRR